MMERKDTEPVVTEEEFSNLLTSGSITESMLNYLAANTSYSSGTISATSTTSISVDQGNLEDNVSLVQQQQQQHFHQLQHFHQQQTEVPEVNTVPVNNRAGFIDMNLANVGHSFVQQWHTQDPSSIQNGELRMVPPNDVLQPNLGFNTQEPEPEPLVDSSQVAISLSLQPWPGIFEFQRIVPTDNKDKNKWCYSEMQEKLYVNSGVAVPVGIQLNERLTNATLQITPVYKQSQYLTEPVTRCHNCTQKSGKDDVARDFICQVDGVNADYTMSNNRHVVTLPLQQPAPGESFTTVLVKIMCLTSCVGGPNRKPFALVFSLNYGGKVVGRQVLDVKCCKCPSRDMLNDEKGSGGHRGGRATTYTGEEVEKYAKVRKLASELQVSGKKRKYPKIKPEPGSEQQYVYMKVPVEHKEKVREYINGLVLVSQTQSQDLYLPLP